ncbi:hypothetical protein AURDEDRAFT_175396 [Auricularia subglabra TFB-10046 SS5]|nr:hypothetical protein AURDEDRAFT_175396 [Auricularia subglabra TFB-10046 SS5]
MRPSEAASFHHTFPLEQPSPVRRVMASQSNAVCPVTPPPALPPPPASPLLPIDPVLLDPPVTARRGHLPSHTQYTPGSRWQTLTESLSNSATASVLVSNTRITSAQVAALNHSPIVERVPPSMVPDWSVLNKPDTTEEELCTALAAAHKQSMVQQAVTESSHATMVIQGLVIKKLNTSLYGKEERDKDKTRTHFPKGLGRAVTHDGLEQEIEADTQRKQLKLQEKDKRKRRKEAKKRAKEEAEAKWSAIKAAHELALIAWAQACVGKTGRNKPPKPKRAPKPKPEEVVSSDEESSGSEDEMEIDY